MGRPRGDLGVCGDGESLGWSWGSGAGGRRALPAPCASPLPARAKEPFVLLGFFFFPPLLIPNQEIKGRQRLRLFPLCRDLESSGRGEPSLSRRLGAGGRAAQVEGPGPGGTPGGTPGGGHPGPVPIALGAGATMVWVLVAPGAGPFPWPWGASCRGHPAGAGSGAPEPLPCKGGGRFRMDWPARPASWRFRC